MKPKAAWFSPLPPVRSGIAEYSQDLLPWLGQLMDIDLFVEDPQVHQNTPLASEFPIFSFLKYRDLNRPIKYDINIYHMGNNISHRFVYLSLVETPGIVVLHEPMLHHFMLEMLSDTWTRVDYSRELDYNYGAGREEIEATIENDSTEQSRFRYPMIQRVVDSSMGIIVHSEFAKNEVLRHNPPCPVKVVNMPYVADEKAGKSERKSARAKLGLNPNDFIIGTFGFVTPAKRIEAILDAFKMLLNDVPDARLIIVGGHVPEYPVEDIISSKGLEERVLLPGYVDFQDLQLYMISCDLAISLRWPSAGETPASAVRLLGAGCPVILSDSKAFAEFPDKICVKVKPDANPDEIRRSLLDLCRDRKRIVDMGEAAKRYITQYHGVQSAAEDYLDFTQYVIEGNPNGRNGEGSTYKEIECILREALLEEIAVKLAGMEVGATHLSLLDSLAGAVDSIFGRMEKPE